MLDLSLELHPQVALRPEPFGALAYHYGNRRLVFLKHADMVTVARQLGLHARSVRHRAPPLAVVRHGIFVVVAVGGRP